MARVWMLLALTTMLAFPASSPAADSSAKNLPAKAGEWPQWRGPDRTGISADVGLLKDWNQRKPSLLWTAPGMGGGYASVSLADGRIYTTGNQRDGQAVICVNAADGKVLWTSRLTDSVPDHSYDGSRCTPSLDGDRLYAIASSGKIACLKTADGSIVWSRDFAEWGGKMMSVWGFSESPLVDGDRVLCTPGGPAAMLVALEKQTGRDIWKTSIPNLGRSGEDGAGYSSIVVSNAGRLKQYVQLVGKGLIGVRATDGKFLWGYNRVANGTANIPTPLVFGDYIFCSTGYGTGAALVKLTKSGANIRCDEQYFLPGDKIQNHHGQMILKDGFVYLGSGHRNGFPACVELATGRIAWGGKERGAGSGSAAITLADGNLVFRYESGEIALIEATPRSYNLKGSFKPQIVGRNPCWSHPVVIGGRMYLRDQDSLMCYDVRE